MDKKQKDEWLDLFAKAFHGVIEPHIKGLATRLTKVEGTLNKVESKLTKVEGRLTKVENGLTRVEGEVLDLKHEVKGLRNAETDQDIKLSDHETRLTTLEAA